MIVEKTFIDAINYAKKSGVMIRPEYWSLWIRYVKSKGGFFWCDKNGGITQDRGLDKSVVVCDKILDVTRWEFMCDVLVDDTEDSNDGNRV